MTVPTGLSPEPVGDGRRRAWLVTAAAALVVLLYLTGWSTYVATHMVERYRQLDPGAVGTRLDGDYRLLSLVRSDRLGSADGGDPQRAEAGSTFVVAQLELTQHRSNELFVCSVDLLGPGGRLWESTVPSVSREQPYCSSDDVVIGTPYRFESVFVVPLGYADRVVGVSLTDHSGPQRTQVLRPPR